MGTTKAKIEIGKIFDIDRNPYCNEEQIYSIKIRFEIGFRDYVVTISSGYDYSITLEGLSLSRCDLKEVSALSSYLNKAIKRFQDKRSSWSYLSLSREYQIDHFWELVKSICGDRVSFEDYRARINSWRSIEEKSSRKLITKKLEEERVAA